MPNAAIRTSSRCWVTNCRTISSKPACSWLTNVCCTTACSAGPSAKNATLVLVPPMSPAKIIHGSNRSEGHPEPQTQHERVAELVRRARVDDPLDVGLQVEPRQRVPTVVELEHCLVI